MEFSFSDRIGLIDSSPIRKAFELAKTIDKPINFSIGQPHFPCPPNIIQAMNESALQGKTSYTLTGGIPELKSALVEKYKSFNKINYATEDRILITSGISSSLFLLFQALINSGDECLVIEPYFLMYPAMIRFSGGKVTTLSEDFTPEDLKPLESKKFKLIIFSTPSNPTGTILTKQQLCALAGLAEKTGAVLISDEIYELFDYDKQFFSIGSEYENTVTLSGFSKTYNMTGLRLSSILGPKPIIDQLTKLQQYTIVCAPSIVQWAGIEALKTDMRSYIQDYREKRDFVYQELKDHYPLKKSGGAFYFFLQVPENDEEFVKRAVLEKKLILVPGFIFCGNHNHVRLSFANDWEPLRQGIKALQELSGK